MKKLLIALMFALVLSGCDKKNDETLYIDYEGTITYSESTPGSVPIFFTVSETIIVIKVLKSPVVQFHAKYTYEYPYLILHQNAKVSHPYEDGDSMDDMDISGFIPLIYEVGNKKIFSLDNNLGIFIKVTARGV